MVTLRRLLILPALAALVTACTIEPPLHLPGEDIETQLPEIAIDIDAIWDIDANWRDGWWYGWDDQDVKLSGAIEYPQPRDYEARLHFLGSAADGSTQYRHAVSAVSSTMRRRMDYGYHNLLFWSNICTPDGTQCVIIDESDIDKVEATTTPTRLSYPMPGARSTSVLNNPEIFYAGMERNFYVSPNLADYDYFDSERNVWVKHLRTTLDPVVYIYLVQVVIYNNNGRVVGPTDNAAISSLAAGVTLQTGTTHERDTYVAFPMRMKNKLPARGGKEADIIGGKLTTFGLCGMPAYSKSRASRNYNGSRADLNNSLVVNFQFSNNRDSTYTFDVTRQMQTQAHGGVITIEIDADTLVMPRRPGGSTSGFDPHVGDYTDQHEHDFDL